MSETMILPMTSEQRDTPPTVAPSPHVVRRALLDSGYNLTAFVIALPALVVTVTGVAVGLGTLVVWVGLVVLCATIFLARGIAHVERLRMRSLLGREAPSPAYHAAAPGAGLLRRPLAPLRDPQSWLDLLWGVVGFVTGTLAFVVTVVWWAAVGNGLTYWFWQRWLPTDGDSSGLAELIGFGNGGRAAESLLQALIGLLALVTAPFVLRLAATIHSGTASVLLCSRAELQGEVRRIAGGRDAARVAESDSLRRLERDIHDGPQQRLVRLTMDLGRARAQLGPDAGAAGETLDAAMRQARDTLDELRALSRGIAPPLLVDRGLEAALRELVQRSDVPVTLQLEVARELPPHVETALYFVVSEALTNVNKHSGATTAEVAVVTSADGVVAVVRDDGRGGAGTAKGSGLAGLEQRLAGVDGRLLVDSPEDGGTTLTAVVPA